MTTATAPAPLTARQQEVLDTIARLYREHGFPPTFRMIGREAGISTNAVMCHIRPLVKKGALLRVMGSGSGGHMAVHYVPAVGEDCCPCCGRHF